MNFTIQNKSGENIVNIMRGAGYRFLSQNQKSGEMNFVRPIEGSSYPRFHFFIKYDKNIKDKPLSLYSSDRKNKEIGVCCGLHLDQRRPVYKGAPHAHNADYDGEVVEKEIERIKEIFQKV